MRVNRLDWLRVLKIVKSTGVNEVKFDEDGTFGSVSEDKGVLVFGKGIGFGRKLGLGNIDKLIKMLDSLPDIEVNLEFEENKLVLAGGKGLVFGYRLSGVEHIEGVGPEKKTELQTGTWEEKDFQIEELAEIKKLFSILKDEEEGVSGRISFITEEGQVKVLVGNKNTFYGQVVLGDMNLDKKYMFWAGKVSRILDVLDETRVVIGFKKGDMSLMSVKIKDFTWFIGALIEE